MTSEWPNCPVVPPSILPLSPLIVVPRGTPLMFSCLPCWEVSHPAPVVDGFPFLPYAHLWTQNALTLVLFATSCTLNYTGINHPKATRNKCSQLAAIKKLCVFKKKKKKKQNKNKLF